MKTYRVRSVEHNNHRKVFTVGIVGRPDVTFTVPYSFAGVDGLVETAEVDDETGGAAFLWVTRDGVEDAMLAEQILYMHRDPEVVREHLIHQLAVRADRLRRERKLSAGVLAELAGTTRERVAFLLGSSTTSGKSIDALVKLLVALGDDVEGRLAG